jgi:hypothetical protein
LLNAFPIPAALPAPFVKRLIVVKDVPNVAPHAMPALSVVTGLDVLAALCDVRLHAIHIITPSKIKVK